MKGSFFISGMVSMGAAVVGAMMSLWWVSVWFSLLTIGVFIDGAAIAIVDALRATEGDGK